MGIRVQPRMVEVPEDEPFRNDLLNLKESAETLTSLIETVEGPCVMGIDAPWGAGKTTFLKMWAQHMRNQEFPVVELDAWETDFAQDPFIALATELEAGLTAYSASADDDPAGQGNGSKDRPRRFGKTEVDEFGRLISQVTVQVLRQRQVINQLIVEGDLQLSGEQLDLSVVQDAVDCRQGSRADGRDISVQTMQGQNIADQRMPGRAEAGSDGYRKTAKLLEALKKSLREVVASSPEYTTSQAADDASRCGEPSADARADDADSSPQADDGDHLDNADTQPGNIGSQPVGADEASEGCKPLVVVIDELDRCRPTYAIELLEVAKHLFAVDGVVFVLGVNRSELAESVKAVYGASFDAEGYLHRFIDIDIRLPQPDRGAFIDSQMKAIGMHAFLANIKHTKDIHALEDFPTARELLMLFFNLPELGLRDIEQALYRLGILLASIKSNEQYSFIMTTIFLVILRTIDRRSYDSLVSGSTSDRQIIKQVFDTPGMQAVRMNALQDGDKYWKDRLLFEAMIIIGSSELRYINISEDLSITTVSDMCKYCSQIIETENIEYTDQEIAYAHKLMETVDRLCRLRSQRESQVGLTVLGFTSAVRRLELVRSGSSGS